MLDAYIIEKIKREHERKREENRIPLQIENPDNDPRPRSPEPAGDEPTPERGVVIIDF